MMEGVRVIEFLFQLVLCFGCDELLRQSVILQMDSISYGYIHHMDTYVHVYGKLFLFVFAE